MRSPCRVLPFPLPAAARWYKVTLRLCARLGHAQMRVSLLPSLIAIFSAQHGGVKLREKRSEASGHLLSSLPNYLSSRRGMKTDRADRAAESEMIRGAGREECKTSRGWGGTGRERRREKAVTIQVKSEGQTELCMVRLSEWGWAVREDCQYAQNSHHPWAAPRAAMDATEYRQLCQLYQTVDGRLLRTQGHNVFGIKHAELVQFQLLPLVVELWPLKWVNE